MTNPHQPFTLTNIRAGRPKTGMHEQLVATLNALIREGYLQCSPKPEIGNSTMTLVGLKEVPLIISEPIVTRGSVWLVFQAIMPAMLAFGGKVNIIGRNIGCNSIINSEHYQKILDLVDLNVFTFTEIMNGIDVNVTIELNKGIGKSQPIIFNGKGWTSYTRNVDILKRYYFVDKDLKTCLIKDRLKKPPKQFEWQQRVLSETDYNFSVFDNIMGLCLIFSGKFIYPKILDEDDFDGHMRSAYDLATYLDKCGWLSLQDNTIKYATI